MPRIKKPLAFIFDMDGTLTDSMKVHAGAWLDLFADNGVKMNLLDYYMKTAGMPARETVRFFIKEPLTNDEVGSLVAQKDFLYRVRYRKKIKPLGGLMDFLRAARKLKIPMAVATGGSPKDIAFILGGLKIKSYFDAVIGAADVTKGKPHPEPFLKAAAKLNMQPRHCIVFEDAMPGLEAASRAGMQAVALTTSHRAAEFRALKNQPIRIAKDFSSLHPKDFFER